MTHQDIILHWYPSSPFAQKVAWALLFKKVEFKTVLISPIEPRPLRRPLDAGYRKTPVLQIGNHTYCDTKIILAELEERFPEPSFYPTGDNREMISGLSRWMDSILFDLSVSQFQMGNLGKKFIEDRSSLSGRKIDPERLKFTIPYMNHSLKAELQIAENFVKERFDNGKRWALGTESISILDLHFGMITWFLQGLVGREWVKKTVPVLNGHLERLKHAIDFNKLKTLPKITSEEALKIAKEQASDLPNAEHDGSLDIKLGQLVSIVPADSSKTAAVGTLAYSTLAKTVIQHKEDKYGFVGYTHFPVVGYVVFPNKSKL
ncbi:hypothetical protein A0J61_00873 [Choanephora cucurbitarum]|uniref:GST N-terminal domain-containing protein n=1 Tax=Choanephora cucurbitarum TaxID=101091 RepID=A0A1C7NRM8_9FUNG|nr:hypothetical protein A0J61_00873 [Choanephora cucurbitarum]